MKQYEMVELSFNKKTTLDTEVTIALEADITRGDEHVTVKGFYAGNDTFKIRFLPMQSGTYHYSVRGEIVAEGSLEIQPAEEGKHGILQSEGTHVKFTDGTYTTLFGTTVYALAHQSKELIAQTLQTLKKSPFNKIRLCMFPKHYQYNHNEPEYYPFFTLPGKTLENVSRKNGSLSMVTEPLWDVKRPDPKFWDAFEEILLQLGNMGITVDLILFHPYDRWGFSILNRQESLIYLDYVMRRLSSFPNLMWSIANEYDLVHGKEMEDWNAFEEFIAKNDPYHHMLSNHNCFVLYDYARPNITHVSVQTRDPSRVQTLQMKYNKPVFIDECAYEGNLEETFGSLTGQEMSDRFWKITVTGGYATHGETFVDYDSDEPDEEIVFWAKGGKLKGESPARIAYLKEFVESLPGPIQPYAGSGFAPLMYMDRDQLQEMAKVLPSEYAVTVLAVSEMGEEERLYHLTTEGEYNGHVGEQVYIRYLGRDIHGRIQIDLPMDKKYKIEAIDTWNMTRQVIATEQRGTCKIRIPEKPWMAVVATEEVVNS